MAASVRASLLALGCVLSATHVPAALAQQPGPGALSRITRACQAETLRFCPALDSSVPRPRDQLICLRPYRSSLSFNCRRAVNAAIAR